MSVGIEEIFMRAVAAHLIGDWFLQNEWMAVNKVKPLHPAGWIHALIHFGLLWALAFPGDWEIAAIIAGWHWFIDLRFLLAWWRKKSRQTTTGELGTHVAIWQDQAAHILILVYVCCYIKSGQ